MPKLGVAVVGLGRWGINLLRAIGEVEGAEVTAICDTDLEALARAGGGFKDPGGHLFTDFDVMLTKADLDAVVIATPANTHVDLTLRAVDRGKHVFVEKPAASGTGPLRYIEGLLGDDQTYMVGHTFLYNDLVLWMKDHIDSGGIGKTLYATGAWLNWGRVREDVDAFWNFFQHPLSILLYLFGFPPQDVFWTGMSTARTMNADAALVLMKFGTAVAQAALSWLCPVKTRQMMVVGDKGTIIFDDMEQELRLIQGDSTKRADFETFGAFQLLRNQGQVLIPSVEYREPLVNEMRHFVHCCLTGAPPRTDIDHALLVTEVMERATRI